MNALALVPRSDEPDKAFQWAPRDLRSLCSCPAAREKTHIYFQSSSRFHKVNRHPVLGPLYFHLFDANIILYAPSISCFIRALIVVSDGARIIIIIIIIILMLYGVNGVTWLFEVSRLFLYDFNFFFSRVSFEEKSM